MKLSEAIRQLQNKLAAHGDLELLVVDKEMGEDYPASFMLERRNPDWDSVYPYPAIAIKVGEA